MLKLLQNYDFKLNMTVVKFTNGQEQARRRGTFGSFFNTFPNFSQSVSNNRDFRLHSIQALQIPLAIYKSIEIQC